MYDIYKYDGSWVCREGFKIVPDMLFRLIGKEENKARLLKTKKPKSNYLSVVIDKSTSFCEDIQESDFALLYHCVRRYD